MQQIKPDDKLAESSYSSNEGKGLDQGKIPFPVPVNKRDSGYCTDVINSPAAFNSPASLSSGRSAPRRFTYDNYDTDVDLPAELEDMILDENEEVFVDVNSGETNSRNDFSEILDQDLDDVDKEVANLTGSSRPSRTKSEPITIQRPQAPVPTPGDIEDEDDQGIVLRQFGDYTEECHMISSSYHHIAWTRRDRSRHRFRPIASRSCGTQTPSPHGQIIRQALVEASRPGRPRLRLRIRTESENSDYASQLPDVIPFVRDRSTSLPAVPSLRQTQEQEVGRELRRISDEFHSSFTPYRRDKSGRQASSLPTRVTVNFHATWNRIRRVFSNSALSQDCADRSDHTLSPH